MSEENPNGDFRKPAVYPNSLFIQGQILHEYELPDKSKLDIFPGDNC